MQRPILMLGISPRLDAFISAVPGQAQQQGRFVDAEGRLVQERPASVRALNAPSPPLPNSWFRSETRI